MEGGEKGGEEAAAPAAALSPSWRRSTQFVRHSDNNRGAQGLCWCPVSSRVHAVPRASQGSPGSPLPSLLSPFSASSETPLKPPCPLLNSKVPSTAPTPQLPAPSLAPSHYLLLPTQTLLMHSPKGQWGWGTFLAIAGCPESLGLVLFTRALPHAHSQEPKRWSFLTSTHCPHSPG